MDSNTWIPSAGVGIIASIVAWVLSWRINSVRGEERVGVIGSDVRELKEDFRAGMREAGVVILTTDQDADEQLGSWTREENYKIRQATAGLLANVEARGGAIAWEVASGVACTVQEADEEAAR